MLKKILEEIERLEKIQFSSYTEPLITLKDVKQMILKYMNGDECGECSRRKWYQKGYEDGKKDNDGWIPVEDDKKPGEYETVLCVTDQNYWFVAVYNSKYGFRTGDINVEGEVIAWRPLPEPPYRPEKGAGE